MNMMIDAMRAALKELEDVLECINQDKMPFDGDDFHETLRTLRQAIAEAEKDRTLQEISDIEQWDTSDMAHRSGGLSVEQEPVAWMTNSEQDVTAEFLFSHVQTPMHKIPLYAAPPKQEIEQEPVMEVQSFGLRQVFVLLKPLRDGDKLYTAPPTLKQDAKARGTE